MEPGYLAAQVWQIETEAGSITSMSSMHDARPFGVGAQAGGERDVGQRGGGRGVIEASKSAGVRVCLMQLTA